MTHVSVQEADNISQSPAELALGNSNLYSFFAAVFSEEASAKLLKLIKSPQFLEAMFDAGGHLDLEFLRRPESELLDELAVEFTALFLGPGGHLSPHESVQRDDASGGGFLWGPETSKVKQFIEEAGYVYAENFTGMPDHISVEFEFMNVMAKKEAEAWQLNNFEKAATYLNVENDFMSIHLAAWAIAFCRKVIKRAEHPFYRELAKLAAEFLEAEKKDLPKRLKLAHEKMIH